MSDNQEYDSKEKAVDSPVRDSLVNTAVNFLLNPDVRKRHDDNKINFLKKKGLTDAEILAAFDRIKLDSKDTNALVPSDQIKKFYHPVPSAPYQTYSLWSRLSRISSSLIVFGVAIYGLHHLYKKFIRPWLLNEDSETDSAMNRMKELTANIAKLTDSVEKLHFTVMKQNEDIEKIFQIESCGFAPTPLILEDLKREVSSLKSILISRHQFPAMPQIQTVKAAIPSWQLPQTTDVNMDATMKLLPEDMPPSQNLENGLNESILDKESIETTDIASATDSLLPHSANIPKHSGASEIEVTKVNEA